MSYFDALGFAREPFPNAPDPDLLYRSPNHLECLRHMEIAVRLRRGLNVVLGEVGTGKSTLCRELRRLLAEDRNLETHLLDDPYFEDPADFLAAVAGLFGLDAEAMRGDQARLRGAIKAFLARQAADERHIVTLLVDEGQKITGACLELLRELLNFESTSHKLLQIVIFAQTEFEEMLAARPNLEDRVNFSLRAAAADPPPDPAHGGRASRPVRPGRHGAAAPVHPAGPAPHLPPDRRLSAQDRAPVPCGHAAGCGP